MALARMRGDVLLVVTGGGKIEGCRLQVSWRFGGMKLKELCFLCEVSNVVIVLLEGEMGNSSQERQTVFEISD